MKAKFVNMAIFCCITIILILFTGLGAMAEDFSFEDSIVSGITRCDTTVEGKTLDTAGIFRESASSKLTAVGEIFKSDEMNGLWNVFAYTTFCVGEAEDSDNDGALKTVFIFDTTLERMLINKKNVRNVLFRTFFVVINYIISFIE